MQYSTRMDALDLRKIDTQGTPTKKLGTHGTHGTTPTKPGQADPAICFGPEGAGTPGSGIPSMYVWLQPKVLGASRNILSDAFLVKVNLICITS